MFETMNLYNPSITNWTVTSYGAFSGKITCKGYFATKFAAELAAKTLIERGSKKVTISYRDRKTMYELS